MVVKPTYIPVINILQKTKDATEDIKSTERKLKPSSSIAQIDSLFPVYLTYLKEQKKEANKFIKANPNRQKINTLIRKWQGYSGPLNNWEYSINQQQERNTRLMEVISFDEKTWELTYENAIAEKAPSEILTNTKATWNEIKKTKKSIVKQNNYLLRIDSRISRQKVVVTEVIEDLNTLKYSNVYDLFYLRHGPLWKKPKKAVKNYDGDHSQVESFSENARRTSYYFAGNESSTYLFFIIVAFIIWLYLFVRKNFIKYPFNEEDGDLQNAKDVILNHHIAGIIFLFFVTAKLYWSDAPTLLSDTLLLLAIVTSVPVVQPYMYKRFKKILYFIVLFFILDTAKTYVWFSTFNYRIYLLVEASIIIGLLLYFTYPYLKTRKMKIGRFGLFLIKTTPVLYFLIIVCVISNLLGYTNLTDLTLKISTQSSIITLLFYGILSIAGGITTGMIHRHFNTRGSTNFKRKFSIHIKALKTIRIIAFISWGLFFLRMIDLLQPLIDFLTDVFDEPYRIGGISFTIGSILTFIFILVSSYFITKFISFLAEGDGVPIKFVKLPKGIPAAISLVVRYFITAFAIVLALSSLGIDLSKFSLMGGALGLGIGFGLQTVVSNFISGLILVFERPILPGDTVEVNNLLGTVNRIGVRSSNISTFDGAEVVVPNNNLIANDLINWTLSDNKKRVEILIGTTYGSDPNMVLKVLRDVAKEYEQVLDEPYPPVALFDSFGDSSLNFKLRFWVPYEIGLSAKSDVSIGVYNRFKELGIEIPFPQQDIHIKDLPKEGRNIVSTDKKVSDPFKSKKSGSKDLKEPLKEGSETEDGDDF